MKKPLPYIFCLFIAWLLLPIARAQVLSPVYTKTYDRNIFLLLDYAADPLNQSEHYSLGELLKRDIGGFRLHVRHTSDQQLLYKNPDGSYSALNEAMDHVYKALQEDSTKIITLFFDFENGFPDKELSRIFEQSALIPFCFDFKQYGSWPVLQRMVETNRRLVVFSMQNQEGPTWLHYIWNFATGSGSLISGALPEPGEFENDRTEKGLFIFKELSSPEINKNKDNSSYLGSRNPYITELCTNTWIKTGRVPNFIVMDHYIERFSFILLRTLRSLKTISGTVTENGKPLVEVSWKSLSSSTPSRFCFPVLPGEKLTLTPMAPGYSFSPQNITYPENTAELTIHFSADNLPPGRDLEARFPLESNAENKLSGHNGGFARNVEFMDDPVRGRVASFGNSRIDLPEAAIFKINNNDFTVSVWVKLRQGPPDKQNYCILGSNTAAYLQGLHLIIRDKHPYLGFFGNDLSGRSTLETNQWYHLVFRYNRINGEQAIFVNGRLDNRISGRPPFKGQDSLFIGHSRFMTQSEMLGNISDLCIWSRALGEHEIAEIYTRGLNLSPFYYLFQKSGVWIVIISGIVLSIVIFYFFRKYKKVKTASIEPNEGTLEGKMDKTDIKLASRNSIRLFGDFEVLDKDGHSITSLFTPKLKHLFLIILLHSQDDTKGITTQELSEILWKDHDQNSRNNVRRVAILKLRTILNGMDKADILNQSGLLSVLFSANIRCDYLEALRMLRENKTHDIPFYQNFCNVVSSGELLKGESFDWLDDYKGFISNSIVDILLNYLNEINPDKDPDQILRIAGLVLANDPLSEEGLSYKMKALIRQNSHNSAQYAYDRFCSLYSETYGVSYPRTFQDVLS